MIDIREVNQGQEKNAVNAFNKFSDDGLSDYLSSFIEQTTDELSEGTSKCKHLDKERVKVFTQLLNRFNELRRFYDTRPVQSDSEAIKRFCDECDGESEPCDGFSCMERLHGAIVDVNKEAFYDVIRYADGYVERIGIGE